MAAPAPAQLAPATMLTFDRTVDRRLVHRAAVSEVFVTDTQEVGEDHFTAAGQLPLCHGYYSDHTPGPALFDPLLIMEVCRQASTFGSHVHLGVPLEHAFLVNSWSLTIENPDALLVGTGPGELLLDERVHRTTDRRGRLKALRYDIVLHLGGVLAGTATIDVSVLPAPQYAALRHMQRSTPPPLTVDFAPGERASLAEAGHVGRTSAENVVLADVRTTEHDVAARLDASLRNGGLFDHTYDHYPAMVLMEAARQAAHLLDGAPLTALDSTFTRFVELDAPVHLRAVREPDTGRIDAVFTQDGNPVATVSLTTLAPLPTTTLATFA
ncbi:ScbA/BarX family gamma-butyrolactone biosynthesis protein [Streptomyces xanthochromogenes]|uniref:ScbA/BarX family gamma-butyrolactone biosynthesis protein n=1 Tax=Streptomyces xanthochromogenes TaxID=67384 RepID=UPI0034280E1F